MSSIKKVSDSQFREDDLLASVQQSELAPVATLVSSSPNSIEQGNRLIADFCGWLHHKDPEVDKYEMGTLKFHTSWDWLMPVVEKIAKEHSMFRLNIGNVASYCYFDENDDVEKRSSDESTILCVWQAVVQFITWYNNQNK